jgi:hypothetical protein
MMLLDLSIENLYLYGRQIKKEKNSIENYKPLP